MIDARVKHHMSAEIKQVHIRLEVWGKWAREHMSGFPARTTLGRVIEEGIMVPPDTRPPVEMPQAIAITDKAVARLRELDRRIVREYYQRWETVDVLSRRVRLKPREFKQRLKDARIRVMSFIEMLEEKEAA